MLRLLALVLLTTAHALRAPLRAVRRRHVAAAGLGEDQTSWRARLKERYARRVKEAPGIRVEKRRGRFHE